MAKFAVYTIPAADRPMYRHGSEILGYDVRAGEFIPENNPTRAVLPEFEAAWITTPQVYGFHMTTGYSLNFEMDRLPEIEQEMENLMACFGNDVSFTLTPDTNDRIPFWNETIVVLHYHPNPAMLMLHTMITARINPYGTSSTVARRYAEKDPTQLDPVKASRVQQYYTPYMLDGWMPHFTLMMPYKGSKRTEMREALGALFSDEVLNVESICLCVMNDDETHYRLYREFFIRDYPVG